MIDAVANDTLDASEACPCCLLRTQEHCMNTPLNNGEMYSDMLKECFNIQLAAANDKCGICSLCAARLRDATDLKRQVLRSQRQLRERLARASIIIEECPPAVVKSETADDDGLSDNMLVCIKVEPMAEVEVKQEPGSEWGPRECHPDSSTTEDSSLWSVALTSVSKPQPTVPGERPAAVKSEIADDATSDNTLAKLKPTPESECDEQSRGTGECSDVSPSPDCVRPSQTQEATGADGSETYQQTPLTERFVCQICGKTLKTSKILKAHIRKHTEERPYACGMCTQKFKHLSHLKIHERIHTGERPYACGICTQKFKQLSHLKIHERIHTGEKPYACGMCTQKFKQLTTLKIHERIHSEEKPYACGMCTQTFKQLTTLKVHERIHTGEKPYACGMCTQKFRQLRTLKVHERIHSEEKPYACSMCTQKFKQLTTLKVHERIHTGEKPYACGMCTQKFQQLTNLKMHERIHTGEKPYACGMCTRKFNQLSHLKIHERIHTGEKPYACELCERKFTQKSTLKSHMRIHTGEKSLL